MTREQIFTFIREHGDERITSPTLDFYKHSKEPVIEWFTLVDTDTKSPKIVGYTAAYVNTGRLEHSITVTHRDCRSIGIGRRLLATKIAYCKQHNIEYIAIVAADNVPSVRICEVNRLKEHARSTRQRKTGEYTALTMKE